MAMVMGQTSYLYLSCCGLLYVFYGISMLWFSWPRVSVCASGISGVCACMSVSESGWMNGCVRVCVCEPFALRV